MSFSDTMNYESDTTVVELVGKCQFCETSEEVHLLDKVGLTCVNCECKNNIMVCNCCESGYFFCQPHPHNDDEWWICEACFLEEGEN